MGKLLMVAAVMAGTLSPALGQDVPEHGGDDHHVAHLGDLEVVHAWARAAAVGAETTVFFEVENGGAPVTLEGAETEAAAAVEIVGAQMGTDTTMTLVPVGAVDLPTGHFDFDPAGLGLRLTGLTQDLVQGEEFELELMLGGNHLHVHVAIEAANATQHSHAGHSH